MTFFLSILYSRLGNNIQNTISKGNIVLYCTNCIRTLAASAVKVSKYWDICMRKDEKGENVMLEKLKQNRSHRSFEQMEIPKEDLEKILTAVTYSASARNAQETRFMYTNSEEQCRRIFKETKWAGAISWNPQENEAPTAYILLCHPSEKPNVMNFVDMGIALQSMTLLAQDLGYGCCILGAYNKKEVEKIFGLPKGYFSFLLLAIGKAKDTVSLVSTRDLSLKYQREEDNHHTVFKLPVEDLILTSIDENN